MKAMDFIIVPTTHLHMKGFTIDASVGMGDDPEAVFQRPERLHMRVRDTAGSDNCDPDHTVAPFSWLSMTVYHSENQP